MPKKNKILEEEDKPDLTPMIDVVFLLLIYFMATMQLVKEEADLGIQLPGPPPEVPPDTPPPNDHYIDIEPSGMVIFNGSPIDSPGDRQLPQLTNQLARMREADRRAGIDTILTINPHPEALHQRSIDVLNAASKARVEQVTFTQLGEE
jgi:biopolymer transport protein ExbD